jgi:cytochrome c556
MAFIAEEVGYRADPVNPVDERDSLMREFVQAGKSMESLVKRIEDMDARTVRMAAVK